MFHATECMIGKIIKKNRIVAKILNIKEYINVISHINIVHPFKSLAIEEVHAINTH